MKLHHPWDYYFIVFLNIYHTKLLYEGMLKNLKLLTGISKYSEY